MSARWLLAVACLFGCGASQENPPATSPAAQPTEEVAEPAEDGEATYTVAAQTPDTQPRACLPRVSGCGCAYACVTGFQQRDGSWGVAEEYADSALTTVRRALGLRDAQGKLWPPSPAETDNARPRVEAFFDNTPCGGECVPSPRFERCAIREGECRPAEPEGP